MCTPAPACKAALSQATVRWPGRSTASDGICASSSHTKAYGVGDHDYGNAWDLTHDPGHGVDCNAIAAGIVARKDPRVKYIIWNRRIVGSYATQGQPPWAWRPYNGSNPHTSHVHVSIQENARDNTADWFGGGAPSSDGSGGAAGVLGNVGLGLLGPTAGADVASAVSDPLAALAGLADFAGLLLEGRTWVRVLSVVGGALAIVAGVGLILADQRAVKGVVNAVVGARTGGAVQLDTGPPGPPAAAPEAA